MKKKIGLLVCMCLCLFCLTACGKKDQTDVDYNGYTYDQLKTACQNTVQQLEGMSDEDMQKYLASGDDITVGMVSGWQESRKDLGNFEGFGDCEVVKSGKTLTAAQTVNYEKRPLVLTYVFNYNSMEVTDVTVDQVYTTGEKMSKAGLNTLICIVTVFIVLIVICLVIYAFRIIPFLEKKFRKEKEVPADGAQKAVEQIEKMEEKKDDLELVVSDFFWKNSKGETLQKEGPYEAGQDMMVKLFAVLWDKLYKTSFIRSLDIVFPKGDRYEDACYLYCLCCRVKKIGFTNKPYVRYVQQEKSITHTNNDQVKNMIHVFEIILKYYKDHGFYEEYHDALEYIHIKFFLGNSFLRSAKIKDPADRTATIRMGWDLLNREFPNWHKNPYLKSMGGMKNKYFSLVYDWNVGFFAWLFHVLQRDNL